MSILIALVALGFSVYCAIRIRQLEKRLNDSDANFLFIKHMLIEIDSKPITLDIDDYIKDKLSEIDYDPKQLNQKKILDYIQKLIDKHNKLEDE